MLIFSLSSVIVIRNLLYHFGYVDIPVALVGPKYTIGPWVVTAVFFSTIIVMIWEEIYKKLLYIQVRPSGDIIVYRFFKKHVIEPNDVQSVKIDKLFSRFGSPNEVILIKTKREKFVVSQFYISGYDDLKEYLNQKHDVIVL